MAFVGDAEEDSAEVTKGVWLLKQEDEAANSGDVPRVVAAEKLFRDLPEDIQEESRHKFGGEGRRLSESTFKDDEERDRERKAAYEKAQARYTSGEAPFGGAVDDSNAFSGAGAKQQSSGLSDEGHRLSDWSFESDQERDAERKEAMATGQARYRAGLAPFEGEMDPSRIPSAPRTEEPSASSTRVPSDVESAIRRRRQFSSGATDAEVDPIGNIEDNLIPSDPNHGTIKSEMRKRRQFSSGASDEYVDVKSTRAAYQKEVDEAIRTRRREQPKAVGDLERLWTWINGEIDDSSEELEHRARQLPRIQELLTAIEEAHNEIVTKQRDAERKRIRGLLEDISRVAAQVGVLLKSHYALLTSNDEWNRQYEKASGYFKILEGDPASQTEDNLGPHYETWQDLHRTAQQAVAGTASSSSADLKIGYDPFDPSDQATIYGHYADTGGRAPNGQVMTVCQAADKHGGTYTYKGQEYKMYHDSHGPREGNPEQSRTAWKILVNKKLQVVGIGRHIPGDADYRAIFPFSTDPSVKKYGPSPDIVDRRK